MLTLPAMRPRGRPIRPRGRAGRPRWPTGLRRAGVRCAAVAAAGVVAVVAAPGPARADTVRSEQMWVLDAVHAPAAWRVTEGQGVIVAVIDSGVDPHVSDLVGSVITGPDLTGIGTPPSSPDWGVHGTWMASVIAGHGHAGGTSGILGVAPRAKVLAIRVVTDPGDPGYQRYQHEPAARVQGELARAIRYAARHHASVISMSLGYDAPSTAVRAALQYALGKGVVVVASSGNSGRTSSARRAGQAPYAFPADYPGVLGVGAVNRAGAPAGFSSDNLSVEVAAPGVRVPAQGRDGQYWAVSGTSPACALTAGVAALIKSRYPRLAPALVDQAITGSARHPPRGGYDDQVGFGTVDAAAALTLAGHLSHDLPTGLGVSQTARFGGGPAAIPPVPVAPRSERPFLLYGPLALACLALVIVAAVGLARARRTSRGGRRWPGGPGPALERQRWRHAAPGPGG